MTTPRIVALALVGSALSCCALAAQASEPGPGAQPTASPAAAELPDGWRWESYRDVEVGVPGEWGHGISLAVRDAWCVLRPADRQRGHVGRSDGGGVSAVGCGRREGVDDPGTLVGNGGRFVAFGDARYAGRGTGTVGDRRILDVGTVRLDVQAEPDLRDRIIATIRQISVDANGCPVHDAIGWNHAMRPRPAVALERLTGVRSVAACRYAFDLIGGPNLISSMLLTGSMAARPLASIADAPAACVQGKRRMCGSPNNWEIVVLRVQSDAGFSRIHLRYASQYPDGVDDGVRPRALTWPVHRFLTGPNKPFAWSGGPARAEPITGTTPGRGRLVAGDWM